MTVAEAKKTIAGALEDLYGQGIFVRGIAVSWASNVIPEDKPKLDVKTQCTVKLEADL